MGLACAGLLLLALAAPLAAQGTPGIGAGEEVGLSLWVRPALSTAGGRALPLLGLGGALRLSPAFEMGGEGVPGLRSVRIPAAGSAGDRTELSLGYGGLKLRYHHGAARPAEAPDSMDGPGGAAAHAIPHGWSVDLLVGAGTARARSLLVDAEIGSENFLVLEPAIGYRRGLGPALAGSVSAGYRFVAGADPLPGMEPGELQGSVLSVAIHLVRDP